MNREPENGSRSRDALLAALMLRLLVADAPSLDPCDDADWASILRLAQQNGVLVRTALALERHGLRLPATFQAAVGAERDRIEATLALIRRLGAVCEDEGIAFLFPKAFLHYPDMGRDVDLLVLDRSAVVDRRLLRTLPHVRLADRLDHRLAGATCYAVAGCPSVLDIHHGRLGDVGQLTAFPRRLIARRRAVSVGGTQVWVPAVEDQLVLQGAQRIYGRRTLRLADLLATIATIRWNHFDWTATIATARECGTFHGLCCYLAYVDQVYAQAFGRGLVPQALQERLILDGWGEIAFADGTYRFPALRVNAQLYWREYWAHVAAGQLAAAARLWLLPVVAVPSPARAGPGAGR